MLGLNTVSAILEASNIIKATRVGVPTFSFVNCYLNYKWLFVLGLNTVSVLEVSNFMLGLNTVSTILEASNIIKATRVRVPTFSLVNCYLNYKWLFVL